MLLSLWALALSLALLSWIGTRFDLGAAMDALSCVQLGRRNRHGGVGGVPEALRLP